MRWKLKLALLLTLGSAPAIFAAEQWLKIKSSNFELFTTEFPALSCIRTVKLAIIASWRI